MTRIASFALVLLAPVAAQAYYVESITQVDGGAMVVPRYDTTTAVEFRVAPSTFPAGVDATPAIVAAFQTWSDVDCASITFTQGADEAMPMGMHWTRPMAPVYLLVYFSDDPALFPGPSVGYFDWAHDGSGRMVGGQVILNSRSHMWSTSGDMASLDVQSVVTALVGRVLTITSGMEGNATYPSYRPGDTSKRTLGTDDIAAIQYVYPEAGCAAPTEPEAICAPMDTACPPPIDTMPGDGGTVIPGVDSGPPIGSDSGPGTLRDSGTTTPGDDDDGGCCSVAPGSSRGNDRGAWFVIGLLALLVTHRLRKRN